MLDRLTLNLSKSKPIPLPSCKAQSFCPDTAGLLWLQFPPKDPICRNLLTAANESAVGRRPQHAASVQWLQNRKDEANIWIFPLLRSHDSVGYNGCLLNYGLNLPFKWWTLAHAPACLWAAEMGKWAIWWSHSSFFPRACISFIHRMKRHWH